MRASLKRLGVWPETGVRLLGRGIALAALVGVVAGLGALAFDWLLRLVHRVALEQIAGYYGNDLASSRLSDASEIHWWLLLVVPTVGGLLSGWLVYTFAPEAEGHGTDAAIRAYHRNRGIIRGRVPLIKTLASALTIGTGGSGGREGPIAQIGAGFGSFLATRLRLSDTERRTLMAAGLGAGIGAIFHAPLAGAIFSAEVLYRDPDFDAENLIPAFIATTVAYSVFSMATDFEPLFTVMRLKFDDPLMLLPLAALAVAMAGMSLLYVRCFYGTHRIFHAIKLPPHIKPAIGGLLTGAVGVAVFFGVAMIDPTARVQALGVMGVGYGYLQTVLNPPNHQNLLIGVLLMVGLGKILTTSLSIGSGGSGGVFGPSMVIGGSLGAVVGLLFHRWMPGIVVVDAPRNDVIVFVILGMASFFAAAAKTPVSTLIMVSEMTNGYALLLPSMWVCALAFLLSRGWTLYREQAVSRLDSPAHRGDFIIDVLEGLTVRDAIHRVNRQFVAVPLRQSLGEMSRLVTDTHQTCFPVVDGEGKYYGLFGIADIRQFLYDGGEFAMLAVAQDLADTDVQPLTLQTDLSGAIGQFAQGRFEELPVVDEADPGTVIGMLRRVDVIAAYSARLLEIRKSDQAAAKP